MHTILSYLHENNPFILDNSLRDISTGVHAHSTVNVDKAESVGRAILEDMEGKAVHYLYLVACNFFGKQTSLY